MKLDTKTRKKFELQNKLKKTAKAERYRLSIFRSSKIFQRKLLMIIKKLLYYLLHQLKKI